MLNYDVAFIINFVISILAALLSLSIAYYSYSAHKLVKSYRFGYFSLAFLSLFTTFSLKSFSMFVHAMRASTIVGTLTFHTFNAAIILSRFFMLLGIVLLYFATRKDVKGSNANILTYIFMLIIILSLNSGPVYAITSIVLLIFIVIHYCNKLLRGYTQSLLLIHLSMVLFLVAQLMHLFVATEILPLIQSSVFLIALIIMALTVIRSYNC